MDCNAGCFWFHGFIPLSGSFAHRSARTARRETAGAMGHLCCKKARERPDTMRVPDDCEGSALEKRTCGEVLNAVPSHQRRMLRNLLEADVNRVPHFSRCLREVEIFQANLLADAEFGNDRLVPLGIVFLEVVEQATALANQHEKPAARAVVFLVRLEVLRQLANALAEQSDLDFRTARIARMRALLVNEGFLLLSG